MREPNPYVGPRPFESADADFFFGRARETRDLTALVVSHRVVLVYSASGAGKSSLLNAGVAPALLARGFHVLPPARVGAPLGDARSQNVFAASLCLQWAEGDLPVGQTVAEFLAARPRSRDEEGHPQPRVAILDQFEELFTVRPECWQQRPGLFEELRDALESDDRLRIVLAIREEYLAQLEPYASLLPGGLRTRFRLDRLDHDSALAAVTRPLEKTSRTFAPDAADELVRNLQKLRVETSAGETLEVEGEYVEPVQLQVVCRELWARLGDDVTEITSAELRALADLDTVLARFYEDALAAGVAESRTREGKLRSWVAEKLITAGGTRSTVYRGKTDTGGMGNDAVDALERKRLVRVEDRAGARWYELTHDRLIAPIRASNARFFARRRKRRITALGVAVVLLAAAAATVGLTHGGTTGAGVFVPPRLAPTSIDFGLRSDPFDFQAIRPTLTLLSGSRTLRSIEISVDGNRDFGFEGGRCPATLKAGHSCPIVVRFSPTRIGTRTGRLVVRTGGKPIEAKLTGTLNYPGSCGMERWSVKTLADPQASAINLRPLATTVDALTRLPPPPSLSPNRRAPAELRTFRVRVKLVAMKQEQDGDIRLLIADPRTHAAMAAELPAAACALSASLSLRAKMHEARSALTHACGPPGLDRYTNLTGTASIAGVGFFDRIHGARSTAANGIELHPVLGFDKIGCGGNVGPPDLTVIGLNAPAVSATTIDLRCFVTNTGPGNAPATVLDISAPGLTSVRISVPPLPARTTFPVEATIGVPAAVRGTTVEFVARIDPQNAIQETSESNNLSSPLAVTVPRVG
jgi:Novel STAND NTPase 1/CARDB